MTVFRLTTEITSCTSINIDWNKLDNKTILITGASGLVGKYLIEVLLKRNSIYKTQTKIIAVGRNKDRFYERFSGIDGIENVVFLQHDIQKQCDYSEKIDFIIHMASNTHPALYATDPIGTEMTNILGSYNLLELASKNPGCRFLFTSSGDVYGDCCSSSKEYFSEHDCGYIDCNTLRAGYIEGKRASEALCNAFRESKGVDFVIARLCRIYGSTMNLSDSKAISQFIKKAVNGDNIVLKSQGKQTFSYLYVYDIVTALLFIITKGLSGEAYNVADNNQVVSLRDLAGILAEIGKCSIEYDAPSLIEKKGASTFQTVKLDGSKLKALGWESSVSLNEGLQRTVDFLRIELGLSDKSSH
jgi:nucleoside-diphosphate-sugar epimerase